MKHIIKYSIIIMAVLALPYMLYGDCTGNCSGDCLAENADAFVKSVPDRMMYLVSANDVAMALEKGEDLVVLDIRPPEHYKNGHIKGALHIPLIMLIEKLDKIPEGKRVAVVCAMDTNSAFAVAILQMHGYDAWIMEGGVPGWVATGKPLVK